MSDCTSFCRVPSQILSSNSLCLPCFFPVQLEFFPLPISEICDNVICKTEKIENFAQNIAISCVLRISEFTICLLRKQNSLCFGKIAKFPVFPLTVFCYHFPRYPCAVGTLTYFLPFRFSESPSFHPFFLPHFTHS